MQYAIDNWKFFGEMAGGDYRSVDHYRAVMSTPGQWGGQLEAAALSSLYGRRIVIIRAEDAQIWCATGPLSDPHPILLRWSGGSHFTLYHHAPEGFELRTHEEIHNLNIYEAPQCSGDDSEYEAGLASRDEVMRIEKEIRDMQLADDSDAESVHSDISVWSVHSDISVHSVASEKSEMSVQSVHSEILSESDSDVSLASRISSGIFKVPPKRVCPDSDSDDDTPLSSRLPPAKRTKVVSAPKVTSKRLRPDSDSDSMLADQIPNSKRRKSAVETDQDSDTSAVSTKSSEHGKRKRGRPKKVKRGRPKHQI